MALIILLQVFRYALGQLTLLFSTAMPDVQDIEWLDEHTFALAYRVRYTFADSYYMHISMVYRTGWTFMKAERSTPTMIKSI